MKRLTFDGNFCDIAQCTAVPCQCDNNCSQKQTWERLKAYEDIGLTPERCAELAEADKDGRLVVLPVKPDAIIHSISKGCSVPMQSRLEGCFITESGEIEYQAIFGDVLVGDFGETVFLSYEEAEAALKELARE